MDISQSLLPDDAVEIAPVTVSRIEDSRRIGTLPRYFGARMMRFENAVYGFMREFAADYHGGLWHFYELSNGGFYMAPEAKSFRIVVESNGYEGVMSADAAGITVCLFAYSHLSFQDPGAGVLGRHFYRLREFAVDHREAGQIIAAID